MRDGRTVIHSFIYEKDRYLSSQRLGTLTVEVREIDEMKKGAVSLKSPIHVRIPAMNE
jgi:hypothetical protein